MWASTKKVRKVGKWTRVKGGRVGGRVGGEEGGDLHCTTT